jgi:serine protease Do
MLRDQRKQGLPSIMVVPILALACATVGWAADGIKRSPEPQTGQTTPDYWLGILVVPADAVLKLHLQLDAGLVIEQVAADSPAAKGGIQVNDILLRFGDVPLADVQALQRAMGENGDRPVELSLLRAGKAWTATVQPERRPTDVGAALPTPSGDWGQISDMLRRLERGELGDDPLRMFFVQPGFVVPKDFKQRRLDLFSSPPEMLRLPKGTRVTITRQHEGPAQITVEKDGQQWKVTEDELDQLPEELRPAVKGMLGGGRVYVFGPSPVIVPGERPGRLEQKTPPAAEQDSQTPPDADDSDLRGVRSGFEEMLRQVRENEHRMQKHLDELRQQLEKLESQQD